MNFSMLLAFLGGYELIAVGMIILLLFGGKKLPELMKGLGKGIREFNAAKANIETEIEHGMKEPEKNQDKLDFTYRGQIEGIGLHSRFVVERMHSGGHEEMSQAVSL